MAPSPQSWGLKMFEWSHKKRLEKKKTMHGHGSPLLMFFPAAPQVRAFRKEFLEHRALAIEQRTSIL